MIKISAALTKKVPGEEPYSSDGVHLGVEVELPDEVLRNREQFSLAVRRLFAQAKSEVEEQVAGTVVPIDSESGADGQRRSRVDAGRRGDQPELASTKQLDFLLRLARRNANLGTQEVLLEAGVERLTDISKLQASRLIDRFRDSQP